MREINARLRHFIIVILFFQTLPLTFNFAPELIVCSLQYDRWTRVRGPRHLALALMAEARRGRAACAQGRTDACPEEPAPPQLHMTGGRPLSRVIVTCSPQRHAPSPPRPLGWWWRLPGPRPPPPSGALGPGPSGGDASVSGSHTACPGAGPAQLRPSLLRRSDHEPPSASSSTSTAHQIRSYRFN